jgi:hypothetical protein
MKVVKNDIFRIFFGVPINVKHPYAPFLFKLVIIIWMEKLWTYLGVKSNDKITG